MRADYRDYSKPWALKGILVTLLAVFILQNIVRHWFGLVWMEEWFALNIYRLSEGYVHTLITYGFLHSTQNALPWHLVLNGLLLYWFGREIEERMGSEKFLEVFLLSLFSGGIVWTMVHFAGNQMAVVVGASAGVFGILYLFCRQRWHTGMTFLFIPRPVTGQQLFWVLLAFQGFFFLFAELPGLNGAATAYSAHLGGFLGAYIYERKLLHLPPLSSYFKTRKKTVVRSPEWEKKKAAVKSQNAGRFTLNLSNRKELRSEVDRILDKINENGFGSLTEEEKRILDQAKNSLK